MAEDTTQQDTNWPQAPRHNEPSKVIYTTHPKVVVGVVLMASLMLFSALFSVLIFVMGRNDAPSGTAVMFAAGIAAFSTWVFWMIVGEEEKG